ncbi:ABC transporter permease [Streptomyces mobaraensis]|uniref:ABC transporter permease n=1 Tax=Streptomyces mobaraensis TaxID=35621 RepID=UPI00332C3538
MNPSPSVRSALTAAARAEWAKTASVRGLVAALAATVVTTVAFGAVACAVAGDATGESDFDPIRFSFFGVGFGQITAICFGALAMAGEYTHGSIRVSLAAVPRRGVFYTAKLGVVTGLTLAAGLVAGFGALLVGQPLLGDAGVGAGAPGALRAAVGCGLHLALLALLAAGTAAVLRSPVGTLGLLVPLVCLLSPVLGPDALGGAGQFLPDRAGQQMMSTDPEGVLGPWSGLGVAALWAVAAAAAGWWTLRRRDA